MKKIKNLSIIKVMYLIIYKYVFIIFFLFFNCRKSQLLLSIKQLL